MATRHERPPEEALLLRGATLVDGTGAPARPGEVLVARRSHRGRRRTASSARRAPRCST